jgi:hypothetical protein
MNRIDVINPDYKKLLEDGYQPHIESIKFIEWQKVFAPEKNKSDLIHYLILDSLFADRPFNVIQCSRGVGKTTTSELVVIYTMLMGRFPGMKDEVNYCLFLGDSEDNGVKQFIDAVYLKIINNPKIEALITIVKKVKNELEVKIGDRTFWLVGRGAKQSPRGTKRGPKKDIRPQLLIADDVTNEDDAKSEIEREEIKTRFNRAFLPALEPGNKKVILIGTPQHEDDIILTKMRNKEWNRVKLPIANEWRPNITKEEFVGAWEDRFPYEEVLATYKQYKEDGDPSGFMQEYMLELMDESDRMFADEDFMTFKYKEVKDKLSNLNFYISTDFNASATKNSDFGVILVIGVTNNNDWMLVDGIHSKELTSSGWIDALFNLCRIYDPLEVGAEQIAFQSSMNEWIRKEMIRRNQFFNFVEMKDNKTKKKISRIATLAPRHHLKKIHLPDDHCKSLVDELVHEMKMTTKKECKARRDDLIDCLSNFTQLSMIAPGKAETAVYTHDRGVFDQDPYSMGVDSCIF